jgi:mono/diheme cytochrome c family protein
MKRTLAAGLLAAAAALPAAATTPEELLQGYEAEARKATPGFGGVSAARGEKFFTTAHANDWSCASCHGARPAVPGKHARTGKPIAPLAPAANAERFTGPAKAEKWFKRNCNDVLQRPCTAAEKADVLAFLLGTAR